MCRDRHGVLALMVLLLLALLGIALIPQRHVLTVEAMAAWRTDHPLWQAMVGDWGLDQITTAPWFLLLLLFLLMTLLLSLAGQITIAGRRSRQLLASRRHCSGQQPAADRPGHELASRFDLRAKPAGQSGLRSLLPLLSCWGSPLFHLGLALVLVSSLLLVNTEQQTLFRLHEDEMQTEGKAPLYETHGPFAQPLALPGTVRLDQVRPEYWPDGSLKQLTSYLEFAVGAEVNHCRLAINQPGSVHGIRLQQLENYGQAFFLVLATEATSEAVALLIKQPREAGPAAYGTFNFASIPYELKAKYQPRRPAGSTRENNLLTLRLENDKGVEGQVVLAVGGSGRLGPYTVTLERVSYWAEFVASRSPGKAGIGTGFFLIMLGSALIYLCPAAWQLSASLDAPER